MSKLKTKRGAAKRFKQTAKGRYKHRASNRAHILTKKKQKRKAQLRANRLVSKNDTVSIDRQLNH